MKKLCALLHIKFFSQQDDIRVVNFDEGVLILWPFFMRQYHFQDLPFYLKSHNLHTKNFPLCDFPGCQLLLCKAKPARAPPPPPPQKKSCIYIFLNLPISY